MDMRKFLLFLIVASCLFTKCTYDNEEDIYVCDTLDVQYASVVQPILDDNGCLDCHNSNFLSEGDIVLDSYESLVEVVESGAFLGAVEHQPGYEPMPYNEPKMDECTINKLKAWINDGMPDN